MIMKIRQQRGSLEESLKTIEEIRPAAEDVMIFVARTSEHHGPLKIENLKVRPYPDSRFPGGESQHIVFFSGTLGVFGFTDGPLQGEAL